MKAVAQARVKGPAIDTDGPKNRKCESNEPGVQEEGL